jgi:hypothetical protein
MPPRFPALLCAATLAACGPASLPAVWVLDPGAGVLATLDEELFMLAHEELPRARLVLVDGEALWVAQDVGEGAEVRTRLLRRAHAGGEQRELAFARLAVLVSDGAGGLFALDRVDGERTRLWHVEPWLTRRFLAECPGVTTLAAGHGELLCGTGAGELWRLRRDGSVLARAEIGGPVHVLAAGPVAGSWYALAGKVERQLSRLGPGLAPAWSVVLAGECTALAPEPGEERVWLVEGEALVRIGPGGRRELAHELPQRGGPWRVFAAADGRAWLSGTGALLVLDSVGGRAWITHAQGGFEALSQAVSLAGAAAPRPAVSSRRAPIRARARAPW